MCCPGRHAARKVNRLQRQFRPGNADNFIIWSSLPPNRPWTKYCLPPTAGSRNYRSHQKQVSRQNRHQPTQRPFMPIAEISTSKGTSKLYYTEACTSCGLCQELCPMSCITGDNEGHPVWEGRCTMCLACLHNCPSRAIEHGQDTKGKERYINQRSP